MDKMDRFWANFGKSIAWGILFAVAITIIELVAPADVGRFPWVRPFGFVDFLSVLGIGTFVFGLAGIAIGFVATDDEKSGFISKT